MLAGPRSHGDEEYTRSFFRRLLRRRVNQRAGREQRQLLDRHATFHGIWNPPGDEQGGPLTRMHVENELARNVGEVGGVVPDELKRLVSTDADAFPWDRSPVEYRRRGLDRLPLGLLLQIRKGPG